MIAVEHLLLIGSVLILLSIAMTKVFDNLGVPTLLLFLGLGMLAGIEGPGMTQALDRQQQKMESA